VAQGTLSIALGGATLRRQTHQSLIFALPQPAAIAIMIARCLASSSYRHQLFSLPPRVHQFSDAIIGHSLNFFAGALVIVPANLFCL